MLRKAKARSLTKEPRITMLPNMAVCDAFDKKHGVQSFGEESEAAEKARLELNDLLDRATRMILRLYRLTGTLAVVGDGLLMDYPPDYLGYGYSFRIEERNLLETRSDRVDLYYTICLYPLNDEG